MDRQIIISALSNELNQCSFIDAMWEGGAAAFDRVDDWSDLDIHLSGPTSTPENIFNEVENCLNQIAKIEDKYIVQQPTWHGHHQTLYRLSELNKFQVLDCTVINTLHPNKYLESEIHGNLIVHFDKVGLFSHDYHLRKDLFEDKLFHRIDKLEHKFIFFQFLIEKEINRQNYIEAFEFYKQFTIEPLIELLRIKYCPFHYDFKTRYIYYDLPEEVVKQLEPLVFVRNIPSFQKVRLVAQMFFYDTLESLKVTGANK